MIIDETDQMNQRWKEDIHHSSSVNLPGHLLSSSCRWLDALMSVFLEDISAAGINEQHWACIFRPEEVIMHIMDFLYY